MTRSLRTLAQRPLLRNAAARLAGGLIEVGRGVVVVPIIARALGADAFGILGIGIAVTFLLAPLITTGYEDIAVRECARRPELQGAILASVRRVRCVAALFAVPVAFAIGAAVGGATAGGVSAIVTLGLGFEALATRRLALSVRLRDARHTLARVASSIAFVAAVAIAATLGAGVLAFAALYAGQAGLRSVVSARLARVYAPSMEGRVPVVPLIRASVPLMLAALLRSATEQLDVLAVSVLGGPAAAGTLAAAKRFARLGNSIPPALAGSLVPAWAGMAPSEMPRRARRLVRRVALPAVAIVFGYVLAPPLVTMMLGPGYEASGPLLPVFGAAVALACIQLPLSSCLVVLDRQLAVARIELAGLLVTQAVLWGAYAALGVSAAAWSTVAGGVVTLALAIVAVFEPLPVRGPRPATPPVAGLATPVQAVASSDRV